ncbi:MAG: pyruvate kinase [Polyangiaceae bacterium]
MSALGTPLDVFEAVRALREQVQRGAHEQHQRWRPHIVRQEFQDSARNLAAYLALRSQDLRDLQQALTRFGLSSLGRSEARVEPALEALLTTLSLVSGQREHVPSDYPDEDEVWRGARTIESGAAALFGVARPVRRTRILVTLPSEANGNPALLKGLLQAGMQCVRINCAHDDRDAWLGMLSALRRAEAELDCTERTPVLMDLGGPKVRTVRPQKQVAEPLFVGDRLFLTHARPASLKKHKKHGQAVVGCTLPEALDALGAGERVFMDDGQLGAHVLEKYDDGALLEIFRRPIAVASCVRTKV